MVIFLIAGKLDSSQINPLRRGLTHHSPHTFKHTSCVRGPFLLASTAAAYAHSLRLVLGSNAVSKASRGSGPPCHDVGPGWLVAPRASESASAERASVNCHNLSDHITVFV